MCGFIVFDRKIMNQYIRSPLYALVECIEKERSSINAGCNEIM